MPKFYEERKIIASQTDAYLKKIFFKQKKSFFLTRPMKYGIFSGGKRFRSVIVVNTGKIFNINYKNLIIISAAVECIHAYSLIHDDLPSMDNDDLRRGQLTTHKRFGEATAILAGNSLLTLGFEILSSKDLKVSADIKNKLINAFANCAGHFGIAGGQYLDLNFENKKITKKEIIRMQNMKTGKLFSFCCESIAILNKDNKNRRNYLKKIGLDIGLLFQIVDDLIDYKGDIRTVGKTTKKDQKKGKATLIKLIGYKNALNFAKNLKNNINKRIKKYGRNTQDLINSVEFILKRKF